MQEGAICECVPCSPRLLSAPVVRVCGGLLGGSLVWSVVVRLVGCSNDGIMDEAVNFAQQVFFLELANFSFFRSALLHAVFPFFQCRYLSRWCSRVGRAARSRRWQLRGMRVDWDVLFLCRALTMSESGSAESTMCDHRIARVK